jgi:hypothetical protein
MGIRTRFRRAVVIGAAIICLGCDTDRSSQTPSNLVLVTIDSLRPDMLTPWNPNAAARTPNLEDLATRGVVFRNAWTVTPWTAPSVVSIFTGLYPPSHGVVNRDDTSPPGLHTLATILDEAGYEIGDFTFLTEIPYFRNLGFPKPALVEGHTSSPDGAFARWLPQPQPFFAWFHLIEPHLPYGATGYRAAEVTIAGSTGLERAQLRAEVPFGSVDFAPGDRERLIGLYNTDIEAADTVLGRIVEVLGTLLLLDNTIIVVTADHGEELLDRGWVGHASTAIHAKLEPEVLRVPLLIAGPGVPHNQVSDAMVQHVDLLPTLSDLLGLDERRPLDGRAVKFGRVRITSQRDTLYFDTSSGGNLTPADRRQDRLRGVSDGRCLAVRTSVADRPNLDHAVPVAEDTVCDASIVRSLALLLDSWEEKQAAQRLAVLQSTAVGTAPSREDVTGYAEGIRLIRPTGSEPVAWDDTNGLIELGWTGEAEEYWIEYEIGSGLQTVSGSFAVNQPHLSVGPFPRAFWNDLATHNPYRIRIVAPGLRLKSPWVVFELEATAAQPRGRRAK